MKKNWSLSLLFLFCGCARYDQTKMEMKDPLYDQYTNYRYDTEELNKTKRHVIQANEKIQSLKLSNKKPSSEEQRFISELTKHNTNSLQILFDYPKNILPFKEYKDHSDAIKKQTLSTAQKTFNEIYQSYKLYYSFKKNSKSFDMNNDLEQIINIIDSNIKTLDYIANRPLDKEQKNNSHSTLKHQ